MNYEPPIADMKFLLEHVLGFNNPNVDESMRDAILGEAAKLASEILAPLNHSGDKEGARLENGAVKTAKGFKEAYKQYREGGWNAVPFDPEFGGQGLPWAIAFPVQEMWQAANMSFGLCPLLNQGAVEAISSHGSPDQKQYYLPKLISGEWTGTMNLTEPQAGSDIGLIRTKAERAEGGIYKITGQKIYITYGDHDMADNIIHLVLARLPDAPEDVKGISLFIVPKFLADGARNDIAIAGIEHKLGIHASPTCTMAFGEKGGATGYLIGRENEGLKYMFTMMNNARLSVGLQGVAIAERAYQKALSYANDRVQGKSILSGARVNIVHHPDVRRMLLTMQSQIEAGRAITYEAAMALDAAHAGDKDALAKVDLLTPIVKSWCTDMACEVTSLGVQIHGGMGFIEETGAAQYYRDARILPIYEGTNGIQAADLVFRKIARDGGAAAKSYIDLIKSRIAPEDKALYEVSIDNLLAATEFLIESAKNNPENAAFAAAPYLKAFAIIAGGALLSLSAAKSENVDDKEFLDTKKRTARFFAENILPHSGAYLSAVMNESSGL
jgi:alkylation response protein AidB-like acyl-CoA dehydrogenase